LITDERLATRIEELSGRGVQKFENCLSKFLRPDAVDINRTIFDDIQSTPWNQLVDIFSDNTERVAGGRKYQCGATNQR
jgi:hypothetical protein